MKLLSQAVLVVAIVASVAGGAVFLIRSSGSGGGIEIVLPTATPQPDGDVKVYISGAVHEPGVYEVQPGSRLAEAVEAAGGATDDADLETVNLAARLKDEQHWHVPTKGEQSRDAQASTVPTPGKIDLNSASADLLKTLPGIGDVKALQIVRYREENGRFAAADDLLAVNGIGPAILEGIRDLVEVR